MQPTRKLLASHCRHLSLLAGVGLLMLGSPSPANVRNPAPPSATATESTTPTTRRGDLKVTSTENSGKGSLRQAILEANARASPDTISFDFVTGPFASPQTVVLGDELPVLTGELTIDGQIEGRLWKPHGVTVSGANDHRVFRVAPGARVTIRSLTIAHGHARQGGGVVNRGDLLVKGVTFAGNVADHEGGGIANLGGTLTTINSTFVDNRAGKAGGGLADLAGKTTVTNCTFSGNTAEQGGGLFSSGTLLLRNTILANSESVADCVAAGAFDPASTHNLIEANAGCGTPVSTADPRLQKLGAYNGPTPTLPLGGASPAINLGDNASAVDEHGELLQWDQRGGGDPRFVAGITDIGAFEAQALLELTVDTLEDVDLRACRGGRPDCSLRGAIALANATPESDVIRFDAKVFSGPSTIRITRPLPEVTADLTVDAAGTAGVTLRGHFAVLRAAGQVKLTLRDVALEP